MKKGTIIFAPGLLDTGWKFSLSCKVKNFFLNSPFDLKIVHAKFAGSIEERAEYIAKIILNSDLQNIHLVGHSIGGLSCRFVANNFTVASVTTISSPHHGSIFADKYVKHTSPNPSDNDFEQSFKQLTSVNMSEWNKTCPDNPKVKYFSMGFTKDIMVTPESAAWGNYIYTGECSHMRQMSPFFGGQFSQTMKIVLDNLNESL